jgi:hypothetical protein
VSFRLAPLAAILLVACVEPVPLPEAVQALRDGPLRSIEPGRTTRQELLLKFGTPASSFEEGRILTYDFYLDRLKREWRAVGGAGASDWMYPGVRTASLVLVFGADGVLARQNLVVHAGLPLPAPAPDPAGPGS